MNGHPQRAARHRIPVRAAFVFALALLGPPAHASVPAPPGSAVRSRRRAFAPGARSSPSSACACTRTCAAPTAPRRGRRAASPRAS
jgi:hypothetical protein